MKNKETLSDFRRTVMLRAWGFYRRGVLSLSLSLKLAWAVAKGITSEKNLIRKLFKS
jgi:hypothetical protein